MESERVKITNRDIIIDAIFCLLCVGIVYLICGAFTGTWLWEKNDYNSYTLQALSWLEGRLDLGKDYPWLELAIFEGKYYVSFPPFPSYVLLPFALVFGENTPDYIIATFVTGIGIVYTLKLFYFVQESNCVAISLWHKKAAGDSLIENGREENTICQKSAASRERAIFWTLYLHIASGVVFVTALGGQVWFMAQTMAFTLTILSIYYALDGKGGWSLAFWACSVGCRPMLALFFPVLAWILFKKFQKENDGAGLIVMIKKNWMWAIPTCIIAFSYMLLNYLRFGSIIEFGHNYLPEFMRVETGQFSIEYMATNFKNLWRLPEISEQGKWSFPLHDGFAFWMVSPIFLSFVYYLIQKCFGKEKKSYFLLISLPVLMIAYVMVLIAHKTMGGWQFGNRYLNDILPYAYLGILSFLPKQKEDLSFRFHILLFGFGLLLNLVGTIVTINGWS